MLVAISLGCSSQAPKWEPPLFRTNFLGEGSNDNGSCLFAIEYNQEPVHSIVFFMPFSGGSRTNHSVNPLSKSFQYEGSVSNLAIQQDVLKYAINSSSATTITCNGKVYKLDSGTVFHVAEDGTISQLPFVGLKPSKEYLAELTNFFADPTRLKAALF